MCIICEFIHTLHDSGNCNIHKLFINTCLQRSFCCIRNLGSNWILLLIFIIGNRRMYQIIVRKTIHALTEILTDDDRSVIITAVDTVDRLILRLYKLPANLVIFLQIVDNGITHDHKFAITLGISFIHRNNRNRYRSRIAVRIPVRIDIKPCIQGWKYTDCKCDQKRKLISPQSFHITFKNPENSPHSLVLLHLFLFLSSNINYNVFYH